MLTARTCGSHWRRQIGRGQREEWNPDFITLSHHVEDFKVKWRMKGRWRHITHYLHTPGAHHIGRSWMMRRTLHTQLIWKLYIRSMSVTWPRLITTITLTLGHVLFWLTAWVSVCNYGYRTSYTDLINILISTPYNCNAFFQLNLFQTLHIVNQSTILTIWRFSWELLAISENNFRESGYGNEICKLRCDDENIYLVT